MSVPQTPTPHQPLMVQAPVRALDPDGAAVITGGTTGFAIASLACWIGWEDLAARGDGWYLGVALTGLGLGVVAGLFAWTRSHQRRRGAVTADGEPQGETGAARGESVE